MKASKKLIDQLKIFEGCKLTAYQDSNRVWTIGIGHTQGVKAGQVITTGQAESLCRADLSEMESYVNHLGITLTQGQSDALVDFVYNEGIGRLKKSQLLQDIIHKESKEKITADFMQFTKAGGKDQRGLVTRRQWEAKRFFENV
jgi:lysozyme